MKKYLCILAILAVLLALAGCGTEPEATEPTEAQTQATEEAAPAIATEEELLKLFASYAEEGWEVVDCVIFDESDCGISGAIHYTKPDYEGSMFDFIQDGVPLRCGVEAEPARPNARLGYSGNDRIVCRLKTSEGEFTCAITCAAVNGEVNFTISGGEN